ncbi:MAG: hypothetical protein WCK81_07405 [Betaproteobacteria bacterium]
MKNSLFGLGAISLAVLVGCGGGSSSSGDNSVPQTSSVAVTVIDGAIKNAKACLDKNLNGICDAGEPTGTTDASGKTTLTVDNADVGKYPIVAIIGTDAVDADTGAVTVAYTMKAPADQTAVVSPYTNLVQSTIESTGATTADAAQSVKDQTGLNISVFSDYTKVTSADAKTAQILANAIVVTTQQQAQTVSGAAGQKTNDGATIAPADLNKLVQQKVTALLPQLVVAANDSAVQSATSVTDRITQLSSKATAILKTDGIQSADGAVAAVEANKATSTTDTTATAGASTAQFTYTNANNFLVRLMSSSVADSTPDANNLVGYREYRYQNSGSANTAAWGAGSSPKRGGDLHWNGTQWRTCPINWKNTQTLRDAKGFSSYNYCDNRETGSGTRTTVDVSGKAMADVYKSIRSQGYTNISIGDGTDTSAAGILGTSVFPTGSKLHYQTSTSLSTAATYYPGSDSYVALQDAMLASGDATACNASPSPASTLLKVTLDKLIAISKGTPCVLAKKTVVGLNGNMDSGTTNEGWGNTTLDMGTVGTASANAATINGVVQSSTFYTTNTRLRVAFGDGNVAKYYQCQERYDGSVRNCTLAGTGSYAIQTLGDGRTLSFSGLPAYFGNLSYTRVFAERNGYVYYGYQNRAATSISARLNLTALNAVNAKLGLPAHDPSVPLALTFTSYQGIWDAYPDSAPTTVGGTLSISASGQFSCISTGDNCTLSSFNAATGAFGFTNAYTSGGSSTVAGTMDFTTGTGTAGYSGSGGTGTTKLIRR